MKQSIYRHNADTGGPYPLAKLCRFCGQPMRPKGIKKRPDEYDHAQGCPYSRQKVGRDD